jgi:hypothetical protein
MFLSGLGGGFGLVLAELSDGRDRQRGLANSVAEQAGLVTGAEIVQWDGQPGDDAIPAVIPGLGPYSTDHARRVNQVSFLACAHPIQAFKSRTRTPTRRKKSKSSWSPRWSMTRYSALFHC